MAYKYKIKEEEGHSKYYPGGKTPGLTTSVMNQILKKIAKGDDEDKEVKESLTAGFPFRKTSGEDFEKIEITEPMDDSTRNRIIKNFRAAGWDAKPNNGGGVTAIKKAMMESNSQDELKEEYLSGKSFITSKLSSYPKALAKVNQLMDMMGETNFSMGVAQWVWDFFNNASFESPVNEAQDNPKDIISVDVPLFIRLLEYAREDAQTDMDLHDVAENIIKLSAEGEPLTMANYDAIVGTQEEVNEEGEGGSMSNAAGGYLGKYAFKLPKKQPKLEEDASQSAKPNAKNPGATLGAGPAAGKSGVSNNAYVKQFKYKVVPQTSEGTYVQKGSGMEVKKLF